MASLLLGMAAPSSAMVPTEVLRIAIPPAVLPRLHITPHRSRLGDLHRAREVRQRRVAAVAAAAAPASPPSAAGEADALRLAASLNFADLWSLLRPDWKLVAACAVATLVSVGSFVCVAPALGRVIDVISAPGSSVQQLALAVGTLGGVYIISNISLATQVMLALATGESLAARLRARFFSALLTREATFHDTTRTGAMTSWLGQDVEVLQATVARLLGARGLRAVLETVGIVAALAWLSWPLAVTLLAAAPLVSPVVAATTRRVKGASREAAAASAAAAAAADEIVDGIRVVRVFGAEGRQLSRYRSLVHAAHAAATRVVGLQAVLDISGRIRNTLCVLCTLSMGAYLALAGQVTIGVCYSFFVYSFSFAFALSNVTNTLGDLSRAAGTVARTLSVLRQCEGEGAGAKTEGDAASTSGERITQDRFRGEIEFRGVCFSHPGGWRMHDVSFVVPAGSTAALVGPSGGGKSTVAALLVGLYQPSAGEIFVDGVPLSRLDTRWWRRQLGVVEQDPGLISGKVRDIVKYARPDASDADVEAAAAAAQATAFIERLPQGFDTVVGAGGVEVSGGQRQRLAIARALLPRPRVLLLDEATSALDVGTEAEVGAALLRGLPGCTKVVIAHRLSTVRRADCIIVLAGGRVAEAGSHDELVQRQGGVYAGLVRRAESAGRDSWESSGSSSEGEGGEGIEGPEGDSELQRSLAASMG